MKIVEQRSTMRRSALPLYGAITLLISAAAVLGRDFLDSDPLWHTWVGLQILAGRIPYFDTFSWTAPGAVWIAHSWLAEAIMAIFYSMLSWPGIRVLAALLTWCTGLAAWYAAREVAGRPTLVSAVPLVLAVTAVTVYNNYRPHLFSAVLAVVFVAVLERADKGHSGWLWLLAPLTALWANLHAGFIFAPLIPLPYLVRWLLAGRGTGVVLPWLAVLLAPLANPYGPSLLQDHLRLLQTGIVQRYGVEYRSPDFHDPLALLSIGGSAVAAMALPWQTSQERARLGLLALLFLATLYSVRNIFVFLPVAAVFLSGRIRETVRPPGTPSLARLRTVTLALLLTSLVALAYMAWIRVPRDTGALPPTDEGQAILQTVRQPLFNDMTASGWLIVNSVPVFVDSRMEMYPARIIQDYVDLYSLSRDPRPILEAYRIASAVVRTGSPLAIWLDAAGWRTAYRGPHWTVFWRP
jgi:hypothetical protein